MVNLRRDLVSIAGLASFVAAVVLQSSLGALSTVLIAFGLTAAFTDLTLTALSHDLDRLRKVKRWMEVGLVLIITGATVGSLEVLINTFLPLNGVGVPLVLVGAASFALGVAVQVACFVRARGTSR